MKAPDKLYVAESRKIIGDIGHNVFSERPFLQGSIEYIRKGALLEWLNMAVECYSHPDTVNVVDTIRCEGKKWAFQDVINKINSL